MRAAPVVCALLSIALPGAAGAELSLSLVATPDPALPDEPISFAITVSSVDAAAENVSVTFVVPPQFVQMPLALASEPVTCTSTVGAANLCYPTESMTWSVGNLAEGEGRTLRLPPVIVAGQGDVDLPVVLLEDGVPVFEEAPRLIVDVATSRRLELALAESRDPAAPGSELTYTLSYGHPVVSDFSNPVTLRFFVPDGTSFVSAPDCTEAAGTVSCPLGRLWGGEGGVRRVTVELDSELAPGTVVVADADLTSVSPPASARARAVTRIDDDSNLVVAFSGGRNPAPPDERLDLELTVANRGALPMFDVDLGLEVPSGVTEFGVGVASTLGVDAVACTSSIGAVSVCYPREIVVWSVGDLAAGQARTVRVPPVVAAAAASGSLIELAAWARPAGGGEGPEFAEDAGVVQVQSDPIFDVALVDDRDPAAPGQQIAYTIHFGHPVTAEIDENVLVRFRLPDGVTFASASRGGQLGGDGVIRWSPTRLGPGVWSRRTVTGTIDAQVAPGGPGDLLEAWAEVVQDTGNDGVVRPESSRADVVTRAAPETPLALEVRLPAPPNEQGEVFSVEYRIRNAGSQELLAVGVEGLVPEGVDPFSSGTISAPPLPQSVAPTCLSGIGAVGICYPGERFFWEIPELDPGQTITVTVPYRLVTSPTSLADGVVLPFRGLAAHAGSEAPDVAVRGVPAPDAGLAGAVAMLALGGLASRRR